MMSLEYISSLQKDAARRSQKLGLEPFVITQEHKDAGDISAVGKEIPNLGDRCPKGVFETTGGKRVDPERVATATKLERSRVELGIERLVGKLLKRKTLPQPSPGDCFTCQGIVTSMRTGKTVEPSACSCLASHVDEGYLHGSLVRNALVWARPSDPRYATLHDAADALRRYLRHHLGFEGGNADA